LSRIIATLLLACALVGCSARPEDLALAGKIQPHASVKSSAEITINAPPQKVWQLLSDIPDWPKWQPGIIETSMPGKLQPGTLFTWNAGGMTVHSKLALVEPYTRLSWTGNVFNAHAIHVWTLEPLPGGRTLVKTDESLNGFLLSFMYSSDDLAKSHQVWLNSLKRKAEEPVTSVKPQSRKRKR
jgi:hypothetical protein